MVEMLPWKDREGSVFLPDSYIARLGRADAGVVVASGLLDVWPGDIVVVRAMRGTWFTNFSFDGYRATTTRGEVRLYGSVSVDYKRHQFNGAEGCILAKVEEGFKVRACGEWMLVLRDSTLQAVNGIYLPDTVKSRTCKATVVSAGYAADYKEGDRIAYNPKSLIHVHFGAEYDLPGNSDDYAFVRSRDVLCSIPSEQNG
jgi:co-chaperonin GroES (HSP10)